MDDEQAQTYRTEDGYCYGKVKANYLLKNSSMKIPQDTQFKSFGNSMMCR